MTPITGEAREWLRAHRVARLATVGPDGQPHVVPIVFAFDGQRLYTPVDAKSKRVEGLRLQRVRDIGVNPRVAVILDEYSDDWSELGWVQVRGRAAVVEDGPEHSRAVALLQEKYPQYAQMSLDGRPIIVITPTRVLKWRNEQSRSQGV